MDEKVLQKMDELERYEKIKKQLGERYDQSKGVSPLFRYGQLKSMIKAAILKMSKDNDEDSDDEEKDTSKPGTHNAGSKTRVASLKLKYFSQVGKISGRQRCPYTKLCPQDGGVPSQLQRSVVRLSTLIQRLKPKPNSGIPRRNIGGILPKAAHSLTHPLSISLLLSRECLVQSNNRNQTNYNNLVLQPPQNQQHQAVALF